MRRVSTCRSFDGASEWSLPFPSLCPAPSGTTCSTARAWRESGTQRGFPEIVERSLQQAALWNEVKDRLDSPALSLSGGQQQRLCIARSLALEPEVLLLDEPTSGLDPISTAKVEESLFELRERYAVVIVPHSVQQAARVADYAAFFLSGEMVERGNGPQVFTSPRDKRTEDYVTGRFG